ncbi:MAG TPA: hypothetical protein VFZ66_06720, partial [Herpetosiphonaceae bacterium]
MSAQRQAALHHSLVTARSRYISSSLIKLACLILSVASLSLPHRIALAAGDGRTLYVPIVSTLRAAPTWKTVKQGVFVNAPKDTSVETVAAKASFVVLMRTGTTYRNTLRANGYTGKVVQYFVANAVLGPGPYANSSAACDSSFVPPINQVAHQTGDFCKYI